MLKRTLSIIGGTGAFFALTVAATMYSQQPPPPGRTGAPGESLCTECHSGQANVGPGSITITESNGALGYMPDSVYEFAVTVAQASRNKFGFSATVLDDGNASVGAITLANPNATTTQQQGGKNYVSHKNGGTTGMDNAKTWLFKWKAPSSDVGPVTIYAAGVAANANGNESGDNVYKASMEFSTVTSKTKTLDLPSLQIAPNPVTHTLRATFNVTALSDVTFSIIDLKGARVFEEKNPAFLGAYDKTLDASIFPASGVYIAKITAGAQTYTQKLTVQK